MPNYTNNQLRAELSASQRSAYNFYETESLQTEFSASSCNANYTNSHYVRNCLHRNVEFNTFNETEQLRTEFPASSRGAKFIYLLLNYHVHYQNKPIT